MTNPTFATLSALIYAVDGTFAEALGEVVPTAPAAVSMPPITVDTKSITDAVSGAYSVVIEEMRKTIDTQNKLIEKYMDRERWHNIRQILLFIACLYLIIDGYNPTWGLIQPKTLAAMNEMMNTGIGHVKGMLRTFSV